MRVTNGIPLGRSLLLPVGTVNCVQTLKVWAVITMRFDLVDAFWMKRMQDSIANGLVAATICEARSLCPFLVEPYTRGFPNCPLETSRRVTNGIPLGCPPLTGLHCTLGPNTEGHLQKI
jgi:hypothetical protein